MGKLNLIHNKQIQNFITMKKHLLFYLLCFIFLSNTTFTQSQCEENIEKAKKLLNEKAPFNTGETVFNLIYDCAKNGNPVAENMLGLLYLNGVGTSVDNDLAFKYITSSANKENATAQYNLGRLYKYGISCNLSFDEAIKWFTKASLNGNQRAAYTLGYMYYKGLGVKQDYKKAIAWFKQSTDFMAQHYLGMCYYLGYGTPVNEQKALEVLLNNPTGNSQKLVAHIKAGQKAKNKQAVTEVLNQNENDKTFVKAETSDKIEVEETNVAVSTNEIIKTWNAKLLQYDWSGKHVTRILPLSVTFENNNDSIDISLNFKDKLYTAKAVWQEETLFFNEDIILGLEEFYGLEEDALLEYNLFSIRFTKKEVLEQSYMVGYIDSFIEKRTEFGEPLSLLLLPENLETNISEEMLLALASQEDQFIKLYPVPFKNNLTVQYTLDKADLVQVELYSVDNGTRLIISPTTLEEKGTHLHTITVDNAVKDGLYIVKAIVGSEIYIRTIIKEN